MKKLPDLGKGSSEGYADSRNDSSRSSVGIRRKLPTLGKEQPDSRGRAPGQDRLTKLGSSYWPKADQTVTRRQG